MNMLFSLYTTSVDQFAITYLLHRALYRIVVFIERWYVGSFHAIFGQTLALLTQIDQSVALKITAQHLFDPLYQDHSIVGHTLGFFFRFWRLVLGGILYAIIIAAAGALYVAWALVPFLVLYRAFAR